MKAMRTFAALLGMLPVTSQAANAESLFSFLKPGTPDALFQKPELICNILAGEGMPMGEWKPIYDTNLSSCGGSIDIGGPIPDTPGFPTRIVYETFSHSGGNTPVSNATLTLDIRNPATRKQAEEKFAALFETLLKKFGTPYNDALRKGFGAKENTAVKTPFGHIVFTYDPDHAGDREIHFFRAGDDDVDLVHKAHQAS